MGLQFTVMAILETEKNALRSVLRVLKKAYHFMDIMREKKMPQRKRFYRHI